MQIVNDVFYDTGTPPISSLQSVFTLSGFAPTNIPSFYLYNENILRELGLGGDCEALRDALIIFYELNRPALSQPLGEMGVFTFGFSLEIPGIDSGRNHAVLPIPTMAGERPFRLGHAAQAVLTTGESTDLAVEFLVGNFGNPSNPGFMTPFTLVRPPNEMIESWTSLRAFAEYANIVENVNSFIQLPASVTDPIEEAVDSFLHGILSLDAVIDRISDIMWLYMNE